MNQLKKEEGSSLVEFAISTSVLFMVMFGIIQLSLAFYTLNYVSDAARSATRYAAVRGADSCTMDSVVDPNCNLNPSQFTSNTVAASNPLLAYLSSLGYPGINPQNLSVKVTWLVQNYSGSGASTWTTVCPSTNTDVNGNPCNAVGNAVNVVVTYNYQISVPFWHNPPPIPIKSTSQMVISE